jgi:hypothetical protein
LKATPRLILSVFFLHAKANASGEICENARRENTIIITYYHIRHFPLHLKSYLIVTIITIIRININEQNSNSFYKYGSSDFNETKFGKVFIGYFGFLMNMPGLLVAGFTLNVVSYLEFKQYITGRKRKDEEMLKRTCFT